VPVDPRVAFAAERTLLAWIRTAVALMGFGFVVARFGVFLHELAALGRPVERVTPGPSLWIGVSLVVLGIVMNVVAAFRHARIVRTLEHGTTPTALSTTGILVAVSLAALGIVMAVTLALFTTAH
jgi:putative membrane protein